MRQFIAHVQISSPYFAPSGRLNVALPPESLLGLSIFANPLVADVVEYCTSVSVAPADCDMLPHDTVILPAVQLVGLRGTLLGAVGGST